MKKTISKTAIVCAIILTALGSRSLTAQNYKYYVPTIWEHQYNKAGGEPIITNVIKFDADCPGATTQIANDLNTFYMAYYSKSRGFSGTNRNIIYGPYDTYDAAEKERARIIADKNYNWTPLLIKDFSTSCD